MAKSPRKRRTVRRRTQKTSPPDQHRISMPWSPLVSWAQVSLAVQSLAATAIGEPDVIAGQLVGVVRKLVTPHLVLDRIHTLTPRVLRGDRHAANELRSRALEIAARLPDAIALADRVMARVAKGDESSIAAGVQGSDGTAEYVESIDFSALTSLTAALARAFEHATVAERHEGIAAVFGVAFMAAPVDRLLTATKRSGLVGAASEMRWFAGLSSRSEAPPPMQVMSGGGPGLPGLPGGGLPGSGLPGGGLPGAGFPGGGHPGKPKGPGDPEDPLGLGGLITDKLKDWVRDRHVWDPGDLGLGTD